MTDFKTDLFRPGNYTMQDKLSAAETFLNGGTDFQTPMEEALRLMKEEGFVGSRRWYCLICRR